MPKSPMTDQQLISKIQNEICSGNPVIVTFLKKPKPTPTPSGSSTAKPTPTPMHFMLVKGIGLDSNKNQTLVLNNPGSTKNNQSENAFYTNIKNDYPSVIGYILYHSAADPSMMAITAPAGVDFVVTDPLGRKVGYDPIANISYNDVPGASYGQQSINTPSDPNIPDETMVAEQYFMSTKDVPDGSYSVQVFSKSGGAYYLDYRSYDSQGYENDAHYNSGTLKMGGSATVTYQHSAVAVPTPNATLKLSHYALKKDFRDGMKKSEIRVAGKITPYSNSSISLTSTFQLNIGGISGYTISVPANEFKVEARGKEIRYRYKVKDLEIRIESTGEFELNTRNVDLSSVDPDLIGNVKVQVDNIFAGASWNMKWHDIFCSDKDHDDFRWGDDW